jgi:hypothetical protein
VTSVFAIKIRAGSVQRDEEDRDWVAVMVRWTVAARAGEDARLALQIFAPQLRPDGSAGQGMRTTALLTPSDLIAVRDALDAAVAEFSRGGQDRGAAPEAPRAPAGPRRALRRRRGVRPDSHVLDAARQNLPPCSSCRASRGDPCRTPSGRARSPHQGRF